MTSPNRLRLNLLMLRVIRISYDPDGQIRSRRIVSLGHVTQQDADAAASVEAEKNRPWGFNRENCHWWATAPDGSKLWFLTEGY